MLKILSEKKFNEKIVGITFNPTTKELIVGLTKTKGMSQYYDTEIWSLNQDLTLKELQFKDPLGLTELKGFDLHNEWTIVGILSYDDGRFAKAFSLTKNGHKELLTAQKSEKKGYNHVTKLKLNNNSNSGLILYGYGATLLVDDEAKSFSELAELSDKKNLWLMAPLNKIQKIDENIPDLLVVRGIYQLEGYKNKKVVFTKDYRTWIEKIFLQGYPMDVLWKYTEPDLYTLLINGGKGEPKLKMLKNFHSYWTLPHTTGPAILQDITGEGKENLICGGSHGRNVLAIYDNVFSQEPTLIERTTAPVFWSLLAEDINNDGISEILTATRNTLSVYQYSN